MRARRLVSVLLALAGSALVASPAAAATPSYVKAAEGRPQELVARESVLLARLEQLRELGRLYGKNYWPGWDILSTPIAVHDQGRLAVLIQHPNPPAHFTRVETPLVSTPVYVSTNTSGMLANTALPLNGVVTSMIAYDTMMTAEAEDALAVCLHEFFHAYRQRIAPQKFGDILVLVFGRYPEFSIDNNAWLSLEALLLDQALDERDRRHARGLAQRFLAVRAVRRRLLPADLVRFERGEEANEGLSQYVEYRFLSQRLKGYAGTEPLRRLDPGFSGFRRNRVLLRRRLAPLTDLALAGPTLRERLYPLGMAQAVLLDRLRPGWQKEFETTEKFLDELLADAVGFPTGDNVAIQTLYQRALQGPGIDWKGIQEQVRREMAGRAREREKLLAELFPPGAAELEVDVSGVRGQFHLHGVNPNTLLALPDGRLLARFLVVDFGYAEECALRVVNGAVIYDPARQTYLLSVPPELLPAPDAAFPLEVQTRTFNVHVEKGTILTGTNRRVLRAEPTAPRPQSN